MALIRSVFLSSLGGVSGEIVLMVSTGVISVQMSDSLMLAVEPGLNLAYSASLVGGSSGDFLHTYSGSFTTSPTSYRQHPHQRGSLL